MSKEEIEKILGDEFVVERIIENNERLYAFFVTKKFKESGGNDRYASLGAGPFFYDKKTEERRVLSVFEYVEDQHFQHELVRSHREMFEQPTLEEVYATIRKRKHINFDEFEIIIDELKIEAADISCDGNYEYIYSEKELSIQKFEEVFQKTNLSYVKNSKNKLTLYNP